MTAGLGVERKLLGIQRIWEGGKEERFESKRGDGLMLRERRETVTETRGRLTQRKSVTQIGDTCEGYFEE